MAPPPEQPRLPGRFAGYLKDWVTQSPTNLGSAVIVAVLVGSLPFGGWKPAERDAVALALPDEKVDAAPFEVTVHEARYAKDFGGELGEDYVEEGSEPPTHVILVLTLRNTSDQTLSRLDLRDSIHVSGLPDPVDYGGEPTAPAHRWTTQILDLEGEPASFSGVGPGMDYTIALHQRTAAATGDLPETLTVELMGKTYRQLSVANNYAWADPAPVAQVSVPLTPGVRITREGRP